MRGLEGEQLGVEDGVDGDHAAHRFDNARIGIEGANDRFRQLDLARRRNVDLVQDDDVGELDLLDEQADERALVMLARATGRGR